MPGDLGKYRPTRIPAHLGYSGEKPADPGVPTAPRETTMIRGALEPWHILILALIFIMLFGAKRLPDSAKALGESMNIFKKSIHENDEQKTVEQKKPDSTPAT
jgi:sec-independent protein translocase protein TatA